MAAQAKVKSLQAPVFKTRTTAIPQKFWQSLMVRSEGPAVTSMLEDWGAPNIASKPAVTLLVSARETTGRITSSKIVVRGPLFVAGRDNPIKANKIWPNLDNDITLRFSIPGENLNFSNREARNFSFWAELPSLTTLKVYKGDAQLSPDEAQDIMGEGACFRVSILTHSVTHVEAVLLIIPRSLATIRDKASDWDVVEESNVLPAIDMTSHWTRYVLHTAVRRLAGLSQLSHSPRTVTTVSDCPRGTDCLNSQRAAPQVHSLRATDLTVSRLSRQLSLTPIIAGTGNHTWPSIILERTPEKASGWESSQYWRSWARPARTTSPSRPPTPSRPNWPTPSERPYHPPRYRPRSSRLSGPERPARRSTGHSDSGGRPPARISPIRRGPAPTQVMASPHKSFNKLNLAGAASSNPTQHGKYAGVHGLFTNSHVSNLAGPETVPPNLQALLVESANCSLAYNTWRQHKTVLNMISKCQQQTGVSMSLPWSQACYATFVAWCMKKENRSSSITVYESKIKKIHKMNGFDWSAGSATLVKAAIKGRHNTQAKAKTRLPVTPATLLLLKHKIKEANWALVKKRLIWAIATTMFVGSFRISEVLAAYSHTHAKDSTLLNQDISEHTENIAGDNRNFLKVRLRNPKEDRN